MRTLASISFAFVVGILSAGCTNDGPAASGRYATHDHGNNYFGGYGRWAP